ncbi:Ribonuclease H domain [Sesbania bispinosa]|nr:Ribonuclease H domain [Sesbania bispinosa]
METRNWHSISWDKLRRPVRAGGLGFKSLFDFNQSLIMKLGWGLINNPDALWVRVIRTKYHYGDGIIPRVTSRCKEILAWRGIRQTWSYVLQGLRWVIGDGRSTSFWEDKWLHSGIILREFCLVLFQYIWSTYLVSDFADPIYGWKLDDLRRVLPVDVVAEVATLPCPSPELGSDFIVWGGTPNGNFTTKSAFGLIDSSCSRSNDPVWRAVWRWEGHQRAKILLWMILNNGLKTRSKGFGRGFIATDVCPFCLNHEETVVHILRDCVKVQDVWFTLARGRLPGSFFTTNIHDWILDNIGLHSDSTWRLTFGLVIWAIWKSRNTLIFEQVPFSVDSIVVLVRSCMAVGHASWCQEVFHRPKYKQFLVGSKFPEPGWVKVNVDGSVLHHSLLAGCGGLFRGPDGRWLCGFIYNLGRSNVLLAELRGIETTLRIAWEKGYQQIWVESDSLTAINLINHGNSETHLYAHVLRHINLWKQKDWRVIFSHTFREGNQVVDCLANLSHSRNLGLHMLSEPPGECSSLLWQDSIGVSFSRSILS